MSLSIFDSTVAVDLQGLSVDREMSLSVFDSTMTVNASGAGPIAAYREVSATDTTPEAALYYESPLDQWKTEATLFYESPLDQWKAKVKTATELLQVNATSDYMTATSLPADLVVDTAEAAVQNEVGLDI